MAAFLSKLLKKSQEFLWEAEQETAFRNCVTKYTRMQAANVLQTFYCKKKTKDTGLYFITAGFARKLRVATQAMR